MMTDRPATLTTRDSFYLEPPLERAARGDRLSDQLRLEQAYRHRANGKLILGIALGATIAIGATMFFAWESGSFSGAGAVVDQQINAATTGTQDVAADAARSVGTAARVTGDTVDKQMSTVAEKAER